MLCNRGFMGSWADVCVSKDLQRVPSKHILLMHETDVAMFWCVWPSVTRQNTWHSVPSVADLPPMAGGKQLTTVDA